MLEVIYPVAVTLMVLAFLPKEKGYTYKLAAATLSSIVSTVTGIKFLWLI